MPDNVGYTPGAGAQVACDELTYSGDTAKLQLFRPVHVSGAEGAKTLTEIVATVGQPSTVGLTVQLPSVLTYHLVLADGDNADRIRSGATRLKRIKGLSVATVPIWIKFHDTNTDPPTAGTGVVYTCGVQAGQRVDDELSDGGKLFGNGLGVTVVTGVADADATGVALGDGAFEIEYVAAS